MAVPERRELIMSSKKKCVGESCCLCSSKFHGKKHTHTDKWSRDMQCFLVEVSELEECGGQCVCRACEVSIKRCMEKKRTGEDFHLRWKGRKEKCSVPSCSQMSTVYRHPFSWRDICDSLGIASIDDPESQQTPLCSSHYQLMYRIENPNNALFCRVCEVKRKHDHASANFLPCPNPTFVESFLKEAIGFEACIAKEDLVCLKCYKYFNRLIKSEICTLSNDDIVAQLKTKEQQLKETTTSLSPDSGELHVQLALNKTALHAYKIILLDQAFLFPDMYKFFLQLLCDIDVDAVCTSKSRLLTFLGNEFGDLVTSFCCNKQIGTVFHRTGADIHVILSNVLGKQSTTMNVPKRKDFSQQLNDTVHKVLNHMLQKNSNAGHSLVLNVDSFVDDVCSIAPDLWEHIRVLTMTVNERKGKRAATSTDSYAYHIKKIRRAYLLSVLLFVVNAECSFPFHVLLADTVESNGGSTELITILNRIGAVASLDTLKRTITSVSLHRKQQGIQAQLAPDKFTVASVDNVDFLQSHAAVYSGSQHRSWHATSIQLVQPQPTDIDSSTMDYTCNPVSKLRALLPQKRIERSSPCPSPKGTTKSPQYKKSRGRYKKSRGRTLFESRKLSEGVESDVVASTPVRPVVSLPRPQSLSMQFNSFLVSSSEKKIANEVEQLLFNYFFLKEACCLSDSITLVDLKSFCGMALKSIPPSQSSNVVYLSIVDMHADTREAMEVVLTKLHDEYGVGVTSQYLVVVGDQKTYNRLQELKHAYGSELNWLLPFIGDWHLLHNFQSVLMNVYYDAGLRELAQVSGFRGETLTSLRRCSNFKRTHMFLLQSMEAIYRHFLRAFISSREDQEFYDDFLSSNCACISQCDRECVNQESAVPLQLYLEEIKRKHPNFYKDFREWLSGLANRNANWKFWENFVFRDAFSYFSLFLSIRAGLWNLRLYGIKQIAPMFAAFDRPHYQKLLPCHLHEVLLMPQEIINHFQSGSFVCSVTGNHCHSVALDEAHEMLVNKDLKLTVVRPNQEYVDRIIYYYPVRSQALKSLKQQVLLDKSETSKSTFTCYDTSPHNAKVEKNVLSMITRLKSTKLLDGSSTSCLQSLSGQIATPEQQKDLLSFWEVGLRHFENKVSYFILKDPSAEVPQRQAKLLTYSMSKKKKKRINMIEREKKIVSKCVRRSLAWNARVGKEYQHCGGQYLELPRAISDPHGRPHKGTKSYATKWLEKRYEDIVSSTLPSGWTPEVVVLEGMFLINVSPLCTHTSMREYSMFLFRRFVLPHFIGGSIEVHIVFDVPGRLPNSPKSLERQRRDDMSPLSQDHQHSTFSDTCSPPSKWRELLSCRECKRKLVLYLGEFFKKNTKFLLQGGQRFILAGCFSGDAEDQAWSITFSDLQPIPDLNCGAEEADTRVWLHALSGQGRQILVCSPDTDVFHIGLPVLGPTVHVIIQLHPYTSIEHRYLYLDRLSAALSRDPDLSITPDHSRCKLLQSLFICTGCDYTSFFVGLGKATFMRIAFQHCDFINADSGDLPGSLACTVERKEEGFLAFLRLVGTAYFKKHLSCFKYESPRTLFNSLISTDCNSQHKEWLEFIRTTIWERIEFEDELPPSVEALWRHWLRTCWVSHYWSQATQNSYNILDITVFGWKLTDGQIEVDWDDSQNVLKVRDRVQLLLRGCSCKKGCTTRRCSCFKASNRCGPGCTCRNCENAVDPHSNVALEVEIETTIEGEEMERDEALRRECLNEVVVIDSDDDEEDEEEEEEQEESEQSLPFAEDEDTDFDDYLSGLSA